eukprot:COSAG05_NODE_14253_length_403_cov_0.674342_1_plen_35_part_10
MGFVAVWWKTRTPTGTPARDTCGVSGTAPRPHTDD